MEYIKLFQALNRSNVKYLLCDGLAVNIYGIPRMTSDIDLLLDFDEENISKFETAVKLLMFQQTIPVSIKSFVNKEARQQAISEKNLITYSYYNSITGFMNLDVLLEVPVDFEKLWNNRASRTIKETEVLLVSVEDLIDLKKYANRLQDQNDVLLLSRLIK